MRNRSSRGGTGSTALGRRDFLRSAAIGGAAVALAPSLSSCMLSGQGQSSGGGGSLAPVRFSFAPDPVWDYMLQQGVQEKFEKEHGLVIETSSTWDEFAYFAGGHGDIVSTASYELPLLEEETGIKTVTFGKYNLLRITPIVKTDKPYQTLADIPKGSRIGVPSAVSSTLVWGMFARELHDLDFQVGSGDYELVVEDHFVMAEHVDRGDIEAALVIPEAAISLLRQDRLRVLYDNKLPYQIYGEVRGSEHRGVMGNMFTATEEWFENNREQAALFLAMWEEGIKLWESDRTQIIRDFPQHFAVEEEADIQAMDDYLSEHDWFVDTVYLDQDWIEGETSLYDFMKDSGFMEEDAPVPRYEAVDPPELG
ncbi:twin-arginine translocation signal domain-containing protein [Salinactinospora qingdaonensis]|uniref:ABC transporter substrate-binding protein n=1 Tax=Salinactinospora qingdaonensis TaxID=702744 RepID=A0ABP7FZM1_9ACTN